MSVAKVIEISATAPDSFEDAAKARDRQGGRDFGLKTLRKPLRSPTRAVRDRARGRGPPRRGQKPPTRRPRPSKAGARQLAIFALAYLVYFGVRAITEGGVAAADANARTLIDLERELGVGWEGALQDAALGSRIAIEAANAVYVYGHWPLIILAGVLLFRYRRPHYYRLRDACLLSGLIGLVIFALFPVTPPRLTDLPLVDTVTRDDPGYRQILPPSMVNEYAAMPSFHAGWNLLVGIVVFSATRDPLLRALAVLAPAAMMASAVVPANHFILDVVAGGAIALGCLIARDRFHARHAAADIPESGQRHSRPGDPPGRGRGSAARG